MTTTKASLSVPFVDLSWQHQPLQSAIAKAIASVMERGDFVLGQSLKEFEEAFAAACGVDYAVGVGTGTAAISLGLKACGIGPGDEVLVPTNTFIASVIGVIEAGATPVLVDCDRKTALIDLEQAAKRITPQTKAIIPVHLYGQMVSPSQLQDFASQFSLTILEDAAQAHLAQREGYRAGSVGHLAAFSFYPSKNLGALGNGGMVTTNDNAIANRIRSLRNYGAPRKYYHTELGTNSRLDTLQAAILNLKLPHLEQWNQLRYQAAQDYDRGLAPLNGDRLNLLTNHSQTGHIYHLYVIELENTVSLSGGKSIAAHRETIQYQLAERGIHTGIHYPIPCHLQPACRFLQHQPGDFPQAEQQCASILSLPLFPGIQPNQIEWVIEQLTQILTQF